MAFKQSKLQQIPQRNKDATFGYVKECEKRNKNIIPDMIKYLCLVYFNQNKDRFDIKHTHRKLLEVNGNSVMRNVYTHVSCMINSYLANIAGKGTHIWKFRGYLPSYDDQIGIRSIESESLPLDGFFHTNINHSSVVGYAFVLSGYLTHAEDDGDVIKSARQELIALTGKDNGCPGHGSQQLHVKVRSNVKTRAKRVSLICSKCNDAEVSTMEVPHLKYGEDCKENDIIEMKLDFNDLSLSYKVKGIDYGKAFDIKQGQYKAVIGFLDDWSSQDDRNVELISYQHIV